MAETKIVNIEDLENLSIASSYEGTADQSKYGGPWGDPSSHKHCQVDGADDAECVLPSNDAASAAHEGVNFTADVVGEAGNSISLAFDGIQDIDTVVGAAAVSHDGTGTDVLAAGSVQLAGGGVNVHEDQGLLDAKVQKGRDAKLAELRKQRDEKAKEADKELNKHADADVNKVGLEADWKTYRIALRDITDSYKDTDPAVGLPALDAFAADLSDFVWPVKPS